MLKRLHCKSADDKDAILFTKFIEIEYLNSFKKDHEKVLRLLEQDTMPIIN